MRKIAKTHTIQNSHIFIKSNPSNASRIHENLWVGSAPPIGPGVSQAFDCLVLSAIEYQPEPGCFNGVEVYRLPLNDDGSPMTVEEMKEAIKAARKVMSWLFEGKTVLVTCHMGLNRSGLIAALAMFYGFGASVEDAVISVKEARGPRALSNRYFISFLNSYCKRNIKMKEQTPFRLIR